MAGAVVTRALLGLLLFSSAIPFFLLFFVGRMGLVLPTNKCYCAGQMERGDRWLGPAVYGVVAASIRGR